jgi:hypothetical protein
MTNAKAQMIKTDVVAGFIPTSELEEFKNSPLRIRGVRGVMNIKNAININQARIT